MYLFLINLFIKSDILLPVIPRFCLSAAARSAAARGVQTFSRVAVDGFRPREIGGTYVWFNKAASSNDNSSIYTFLWRQAFSNVGLPLYGGVNMNFRQGSYWLISKVEVASTDQVDDAFEEVLDIAIDTEQWTEGWAIQLGEIDPDFPSLGDPSFASGSIPSETFPPVDDSSPPYAWLTVLADGTWSPIPFGITGVINLSDEYNVIMTNGPPLLRGQSGGVYKGFKMKGEDTFTAWVNTYQTDDKFGYILIFGEQTSTTNTWRITQVETTDRNELGTSDDIAKSWELMLARRLYSDSVCHTFDGSGPPITSLFAKSWQLVDNPAASTPDTIWISGERVGGAAIGRWDVGAV